MMENQFLKALRLQVLLLFSLFILLNCVENSGCVSNSNSNLSQQKEPTKKALLDLPTLSLQGLSGVQKMAFIQFANEELCPCDCPKTFAECLQDQTQCKPAVILGQWIVDLMRQGMPLDMIQEPLSKEIGLGFRAQPQIIDLAGFAQKGSNNPSITLVEFADFECAHCKTTAMALNEFVKKHPDVKLVYKHFPLAIHPNSKMAAIATEAAALQNKFWPLHQKLFSTHQPLNEQMIFSFTNEIGIKDKQFEKFKADMQNPKVLAQVDNSIKEANLLGLKGTPSLFFNGRPYHLSLDISGLELRLAMEKARFQSSCP